jgi:hypothetical protein
VTLIPGRNRTQAEAQRRTMQVLTNADDDDDGWEDEATLNERRLLSRCACCDKSLSILAKIFTKILQFLQSFSAVHVSICLDYS